MGLVDIKDVKQDFMEKADLDEETTQSIVDELPTARILEKMIIDMKDCIGSSGEFMDKKLQQWISTFRELN